VSKLTVKQEVFAKAYIETGNASEAYRRAYNVSPGTKPNTVEKRACELLKHGKVAGRIAELQAAHQKRHDITVDSLTEMLKEDRELARTQGEPGAAINAVLAIAKLHGLLIDSKNVNLNANHKHHHTAEPLSESAHWVAKLLGGGADSEAAQSVH
jgi:phage terminase small subunit